ncbi:MAG: hypothetical protein K1X64_18580 [Myxococcaceae bacterium]|nr:hypothetical protein [Myxococcaceae bacterium]
MVAKVGQTGWLVLGVLLLGACGEERVGGAAAELAFVPQTLLFDDTYLGNERNLTAMLENRGRAPADVRLSIEGPFWLVEQVLRVSGGASLPVQVGFRPSQEGALSGAVSLEGLGEVAPLVLGGVARAVPVCAPASECNAVHFDTEKGECVTTPLPDGTVCSATACGPQGQCFAGTCKAPPAACDDGNPCTTDACMPEEGCVHLDASAECPQPADACHVPACDAAQGCHFVEVADGTACGKADCYTADICISGACKPVPVPEGAACGEPSPCRARGVCHAQVCERAPAAPLVEAWSYAPPFSTLHFEGVADGTGNLYLLEEAFNCWAVSLTPQGLVRFRTFVSTCFARRNVQLLAGNAYVMTLAPDNVTAVSQFDGRILWSKGPQELWGKPRGEQGVSGDIQSVAAGSNGTLWVAVNIEKETWTPSGYVRHHDMLLVALDANTGEEKWSHHEAGRVARRVVLDSANRGYLTTAPDGDFNATPLRIDAFSSGGHLRWSVPTASEGRAVFNGQLELTDGQHLSTLDGAARWPAFSQQLSPEQGDFSPLMFSKGEFRYFSDVDTSGPNLLNTLNVTFRSGPMSLSTSSVRLGSSFENIPVTWVMTTPSLTDRGIAVSSGPAAPNDDWLRGVNTDGKEAFSCQIPRSSSTDSFSLWRMGGGAVLTDELWGAAVDDDVCDRCFRVPGSPALRVFHVPGLRAATRGWNAQQGSMSRDNREQ